MSLTRRPTHGHSSAVRLIVFNHSLVRSPWKRCCLPTSISNHIPTSIIGRGYLPLHWTTVYSWGPLPLNCPSALYFLQPADPRAGSSSLLVSLPLVACSLDPHTAVAFPSGPTSVAASCLPPPSRLTSPSRFVNMERYLHPSVNLSRGKPLRRSPYSYMHPSIARVFNPGRGIPLPRLNPAGLSRISYVSIRGAQAGQSRRGKPLPRSPLAFTTTRIPPAEETH